MVIHNRYEDSNIDDMLPAGEHNITQCLCKYSYKLHLSSYFNVVYHGLWEPEDCAFIFIHSRYEDSNFDAL